MFYHFAFVIHKSWVAVSLLSLPSIGNGVEQLNMHMRKKMGVDQCLEGV
jgi:hypothetical protein